MMRAASGERAQRLLPVLGVALLVAGHVALVRTQFPAALRSTADAVADIALWPSLIAGAVLMGYWAACRSRRVFAFGLTAGGIAALGAFAFSAAIDARVEGPIFREAGLLERLAGLALAAMIFAAIIGLASGLSAIAFSRMRRRMI